MPLAQAWAAMPEWLQHIAEIGKRLFRLLKTKWIAPMLNQMLQRKPQQHSCKATESGSADAANAKAISGGLFQYLQQALQILNSIHFSNRNQQMIGQLRVPAL